MAEELIDIVDDNDKVVRQVNWEEMHRNALTHRAANVLVFNSKGELFVHKRNGKLPLYPGMYDVKMGGIANAGESYEEAAKRELEEEAGIKNAKLEYLFSIKFRSKENNNNRKVFKCVYDGKIKLQPEEVESGRFMTIEEAKKLMKGRKLSPSAVHIFKEFFKRVKK